MNNGSHIDGTYLQRMGRAPRRSATNRAPMGWYLCSCGHDDCEQVKSIRDADVRNRKVISCGTVGKKLFTAHHEDLAAKIDPETRQQAFEAFYKRRNKHQMFVTIKGKLVSIKTIIAAKLKLGSAYVLDFVLAAHKRFILKAAALGKWASNLLTTLELEWIPRLKQSEATKARYAAEAQRLAGMTWREIEAEQEARREADRQLHHSFTRGGTLSFAEALALLDPAMELEIAA